MNRKASPSVAARMLLAVGAATLVVMCCPAFAQPDQPAPDIPALVEQVPNADPNGKHTGPAPEEALRAYEAILGAGADGIAQVIGMLVEPGQGQDYKARYVLHGLAVHVGRPGADAERRLLGDALIAALTGDTPQGVKRFLIQELQFLGEPRAVAPIAGFLADEAMCDDAAAALVAIREGSGPVLLRALPAAQGRSRLAIIQALGVLRDAEATPALVRIAGQETGPNRVAAAVALGEIGDRRAVGPTLRALEATSGYEQIEVCEACLALAANLARAGAQAEAARAYSGVWQALPAEGYTHLVHAVVEGLAPAVGDQPTSELVKRTSDNDPATRAAVLYALGQRGDTAAFDAVASGLKDEDPGVRLVAISALASVGGERAVPMLVAMLPGDGTDAARALWTALLTIQGDNANAALANGLAGVAGGAEVSATRLLLLDILAERRAGEGAAAAFPLATDGDAAVRLKALQALAVVADGTYAPRLVALLPQLRTGEEPKALEDAIVASCQRIGDEQQRVAPLAPVLGAADPQLRCAALRVAGRIGAPGSVTVLVEALGDTNAEVRDTAMRSLADFPNDRPAGTLLDIAKATQNVEHYALAIRGYVRMADRKGTNEEKLSMLIQAMAAAKRTEERKLILGSMARIATAQSLTAVASHLADPELTEDAGSAAVRIARDMRGRDPDTIRQVLSQVVERVQSADTKKAANDILAGF